MADRSCSNLDMNLGLDRAVLLRKDFDCTIGLEQDRSRIHEYRCRLFRQYSAFGYPNFLSTKSHLSIRKAVQCSQKNLITDAVVIFGVVKFCKSYLPWWISQ